MAKKQTLDSRILAIHNYGRGGVQNVTEVKNGWCLFSLSDAFEAFIVRVSIPGAPFRAIFPSATLNVRLRISLLAVDWFSSCTSSSIVCLLELKEGMMHFELTNGSWWTIPMQQFV